MKFSSTYFKRTSEKNLKESLSIVSKSVKGKKRLVAKNQKQIFQKSVSVEGRDFLKYAKRNGPAVIDGFKKLTTEFGSNLNTHAGVENGATNTNTFITIQNFEIEDEEKKAKVFPQPDLAQADSTCVENNIREENFHHFPKEVAVRKLGSEARKEIEGKNKAIRRKKRLESKAKSLQIIMDEGIIQTSKKIVWLY